MLIWFTSYKNRYYGLYVRSNLGVLIKNARLADNWRSVSVSNHRDHAAVIKESLLIGETDNVGQPEPWEPTGEGGRSVPKHWQPDDPLGGVPFYNGPMHVKDVVFANFVPNALRDAGALTSRFPNEHRVHPGNAVWRARFVDSNRVLLPTVVEYVDGDATTVFGDRTGSVTGVEGASLTVRGSLIDNDSCTARPAWNAMQCDPRVGHTSITISRGDGGWARLELARSDGERFGFDGSDERDDKVFVTVIAGMRHRVAWETSVPDEFNLYTTGVSANARGKAARLALPAPGGNWEFRLNGQRDPAPNLEALSSGPSNWYYEASTNQIHVRLLGPDNWGFLRRES